MGDYRMSKNQYQRKPVKYEFQTFKALEGFLKYGSFFVFASLKLLMALFDDCIYLVTDIMRVLFEPSEPARETTRTTKTTNGRTKKR